MKLKPMKLKNLCLLLFLAGCGRDNSPIPHERVEITEYDTIVCFRNCMIARSFQGAYISIFENDKILPSRQPWSGDFKAQFFNSMVAECAKRKIKITKLSSFSFLDCFVEQIFYDASRKEGVMSFTINFKGSFKSFYIIENINSIDQLPKIFTTAARRIADFIVKA